MKSSVIVFPGSNCDRDIAVALEKMQFKNKMVWHKDTSLPESDLIVIPGGFSYGDYLRSGAIAGKSLIIHEVIKAANSGCLILGICNGFQILTETKLLPGTLIRNNVLKFLCHDLNVIVQDTLPSPFTWGFKPATKLNIPIAHNEGNYYVNGNELKKLIFNGQIAFKYEKNFNPNGSVENIAGVLSENGRILGMMPHPERSVFSHHNSLDGRLFFQNLIEQLLS